MPGTRWRDSPVERTRLVRREPPVSQGTRNRLSLEDADAEGLLEVVRDAVEHAQSGDARADRDRGGRAGRGGRARDDLRRRAHRQRQV